MNEVALYIVATPIGNMQDITLRALSVLAEVSYVYAEDTRVTRGLLDRHGISAKLRSYREAAPRHLVEKTIQEIIELLRSGESVAFVSDAGTPGVSDPGDYLVARVKEAGFTVSPIPGASALASILSVVGFAIAEPLFVGFLPKKKGHQTMMARLEKGLAEGYYDGIVLYESPERIISLLEQLGAWQLPVRVCLGRELTKRFEEVISGPREDVLVALKAKSTVKGEIVLLIAKMG